MNESGPVQRRGKMRPLCFEFCHADDGTWSWSGCTPAGVPVEQHGHRTLLDCILAAAGHGLTGDLNTYVVHRTLGAATQQAGSSSGLLKRRSY